MVRQVASPQVALQELPQPAPARLWIPELDGLRAVAALSVVFHHATGSLLGWLSLANAAVSLFFVLSGFLIYVLAATEFARTGRIGIRAFYLRRVLRIWPLYFVVCLGVLVFFGEPAILPEHTLFRILGPIPGYSSLEYIAASGWAFALFVMNWGMALNFQRLDFWPFYTDRLYWWAPAELAITWSISVEEQFYLLFPLVFLPIASGRVRARWLLLPLLAASLVLRYWLVMSPVNYPEPEKIGSSTGLYYATFSYTDMFIGGGVAGWLYLRRRGQESFWPMTALFAAAIVGSVLLMMAWPASIWVPYLWYSPLIYSGLAVTLSALVYACVACPGTVQAMLLRLYPLRVLGFLGYAIYLVHFPAIRIALWWSLGRPLSPWVVATFAALLAITVAALLHGVVERPFLKLRHRTPTSGLSSTTVPWKTTAALAAVALAALITWA